MADLYTYLEYRDFLRDTYEERHATQAFFSYRYMAGKLGIDSSYLIRVLQQKKHLAEDLLAPFCELLGLDAQQSKYFENLVAFNKAKTDGQARTFYEQLLKCRGVEYQTVQADRQEYFSRWYVVAMRSLLDNEPFDGDFRKLAARFSPRITERQAKEAFYLLERLGMLVRKDSGYELTDAHLHSGAHWEADSIREFQFACLQLAGRSLRKDPPHLRDISTMTMNINADHLEKIRALILEFQENVVKILEPQQPCDRVCQLNIQLFPLTQLGTENSP